MCLLMYLATVLLRWLECPKKPTTVEAFTEKKNTPRRNIIFPKQAFIY